VGSNSLSGFLTVKGLTLTKAALDPDMQRGALINNSNSTTTIIGSILIENQSVQFKIMARSPSRIILTSPEIQQELMVAVF
jgi:hypothetical protein